MKHRFGILGVLALIGYFALFSAGIVIDSKAYRERVMGPSPAASAAALAAAASDEPAPVSAAPASTSGLDWIALGAFALTYTPLNVGILCILAGLIGGCASRITYDQPSALAAEEPAANPFRTESPFASMLRSFLVYIAIVAGVSISTDGAFAATSSEGYVRFAATVSFFAFVVGYDPTKFGEWLNRRPGGAGVKA